jgi:hypothetical protein
MALVHDFLSPAAILRAGNLAAGPTGPAAILQAGNLAAGPTGPAAILQAGNLAAGPTGPAAILRAGNLAAAPRRFLSVAHLKTVRRLFAPFIISHISRLSGSQRIVTCRLPNHSMSFMDRGA